MSFCTVINCMDGRTQLPVNEYLQQKFTAKYVDTITEPGPNGILARQASPQAVESIYKRVKISLEAHRSVGIAIVGHHDCAGNPVPKAEQLSDLRGAMAAVRERFPSVPVIGLWVDENWKVREIDA